MTSYNNQSNNNIADEITITLVNPSNASTETICISQSETSLAEVADFACALFGLVEVETTNELELIKDGAVIYRRRCSSKAGDDDSSADDVMGRRSVMAAGVSNDDMILVSYGTAATAPPSKPAATASSRSSTAAAAAVVAPTGRLDFTNLLTQTNASSEGRKSSSSTSNAASSQKRRTSSQPKTQQLQFNLPGMSALSSLPAQTKPVKWDGMQLDDAIQQNPNPECFIQVLFGEVKHSNVFKELNYHSSNLAKKVSDAYGLDKNVKVSLCVCVFVWLAYIAEKCLSFFFRNLVHGHET